MAAAATPGKAPLAIVKRSEEEFAEWISTEEGFLSCLCTYNDDPLVLEPYQIAFLTTTSRYRCVEKSRQVGYSFVFSCEALARTHLREVHNSIFVSYNLDDAKEKIAYVGQLHEELPLEYQKKRVVDSKLEIGFRSNRAHGRVARIKSNPSKAPRGKKGDIYLDELAHSANDREIYKGSTALILRSKGQLTVCSSPLGRRGVFWEIARQELRRYPAYWRQRIPWWLCSQFCRNPKLAAKQAPKMTTAERVAKFGTKDIRDQLASLAVEDFAQEFEVEYSDETLSFYPYEIIIPCTTDDCIVVGDPAALTMRGGRLTAGFDVGRRRDKGVLAIWEDVEGVLWLRCLRVYDRVPFQQMEADLAITLDTLPLARLSIDATGMGMQLAESLSTKYPNVIAETFTTASKEIWCTDFKILLQQNRARMPKDRSIVSEIHSIKKRVTDAGRVVYDAERTSAGHADRFWALVLGARKERERRRVPGEVGCRVVEADGVQRVADIGKQDEPRGTLAALFNIPAPRPGVLRIVPHSPKRAALLALDATLRALPGGGAALARFEVDAASGAVEALSGDVEFHAEAIRRQGYARHVEIVTPTD